MEKEIVKYIGEAIVHGLPEQEIKQNLLNVGWEPTVIEESFAHYRANEQKLSSNWDEEITVKPTFVQNNPEEKTQNQSIKAEIVYSEKTTESPKTEKKFKNKYLIPIALIILGIIVLVGSAYAFYNNFYLKNQSVKIWNEFTSKGLSTKVFSLKSELKYSDQENYESKEITFKDLNTTVNSEFYLDYSNSENPSADLDLKINLNNNSIISGFPLSLKLTEKKFFVQVSNNAILDNLISKFTGGKKVDWVKIDFENLPKNESVKNSFTIDEEAKNKFISTWKSSKIFKLKKFIKKETVSNQVLYHFENEIDKTELKNLLFELLEQAENKQTENQPEQINDYKNQINIFLEKLTVTKFETWVDKKGDLYKVEFSSNAPSVSSIYKNIIEPESVKGRDQKRLADISQIGYSLNLFHNDYGGYPEAENGLPKGLENEYIGLIPKAPSISDGNCNDYYNNYWYSTSGAKKLVKNVSVYENFSLTFCLGSKTEKYKPGIAKLTKEGILDAQVCDSSPENCPKIIKDITETTDQQNINDLQKVNFTGKFDFNLNFYGLNQTKNIQQPEQSTDIEELFQAFFGSITTDLQNLTSENTK